MDRMKSGAPRKIGWMGGGVALALMLAVSPSGAMTLTEELRSLVGTNPNILAAEAELEAARYGVRSARAGYMPTVSLTNDYGKERTKTPARGDSNDGPYRGWKQSNGVTVTQNLFEGYRTRSGELSAKLSEEVSEISLDQSTQSILLRGIREYLNVLRQKESLDQTKAQESTLVEQLDMERKRFEKGSGIKVDVLTARTRLQTSRARRARFEGQLQVAANRYNEVFDHLPDPDNMESPEVPLALLPRDLEEATARALRNNQTSMIARRRVAIAEEGVRTARADFFPSIDLEASWNRNHDAGGVAGTKYDYALMMQTSWDLFNGFSTHSGMRQAQARLKAAHHRETSARRDVVQRVRSAWRELYSQTARAEYLKQAAETAWNVFESRVQLRDAGKEKALDVFDSETEARNAQIQYIGAETDRQIAVYTVLQAMGELRIP